MNFPGSLRALKDMKPILLEKEKIGFKIPNFIFTKGLLTL